MATAKTGKRTVRTQKWVYLLREGRAGMRDLLGGKGANLAEMTRLGLPVPPGLIVTTQACNAFLAAGGFPGAMWQQVLAALRTVEKRGGLDGYLLDARGSELSAELRRLKQRIVKARAAQAAG